MTPEEILNLSKKELKLTNHFFQRYIERLGSEEHPEEIIDKIRNSQLEEIIYLDIPFIKINLYGQSYFIPIVEENNSLIAKSIFDNETFLNKYAKYHTKPIFYFIPKPDRKRKFSKDSYKRNLFEKFDRLIKSKKYVEKFQN